MHHVPVLTAPRARATRAAAVLVALLAALLFAAPAALGNHVPRLQGPITDETGQLAPGRQRIESAINDLRQRSNVQLYVVFVNSLRGQSEVDFAKGLGVENNLDGGRNALVLVSLGERRDAIWVSEQVTEFSASEQDQVRRDTLEPLLRRQDFPAAVVGTAGAIGDAVRGTGGTVTQPGGGGGGGGGIGFLVLIAIVGVVIVVGWAYSKVRQRRAARDEEKAVAQLGREATALLVQTDEALRDAQEELGFVEAQFGEADVKNFQAALESGRGELKQAFAIGQRLDDAIPEDLPTRRALFEEIVARCNRANAGLEQQRAAIQQLRQLEQSVPDVVKAVGEQLGHLEQRLPAAEQTLGRLSAFAQTTWSSVADNVPAAQRRVTEARRHLTEANTAIATDRSAAAVSAREAQRNAAEASSLLDAVDHLAASVDEAQRTLPAEIAAAETDVTAARAELAAGRVQGFEARLSEAEASLTAARQAAGGPNPDPITARRQANQANAFADEVLAGVREAHAQLVRVQSAAESAIASADAAILRARDYVDVRRRSFDIGRLARNRLNEAERYADLARATFEGNPAESRQSAQTAIQLADEAYEIARQDVEGGGYYDDGSGGGGSVAADIGAIAIGGLLGAVLSGGGRSRRSSSWGTGWGGGFGGFGGGRSSGGGFGGFGGGRSSGGGFGGGRASGGGW